MRAANNPAIKLNARSRMLQSVPLGSSVHRDLAVGVGSLGGTIPPEIAKMTQLWGLYASSAAHAHHAALRECRAECRMPLGWCVHRYLDNNSLSGTIPPDIANMKQLQAL